MLGRAFALSLLALPNIHAFVSPAVPSQLVLFPLLRERRFAGSRAAMEEENATGWLMQLVYFLVLLADGVR
jgi:hypothetical protein